MCSSVFWHHNKKRRKRWGEREDIFLAGGLWPGTRHKKTPFQISPKTINTIAQQGACQFICVAYKHIINGM